MPAHDLIVIGAGPGGYVAAIRAAQLGLNVACIEKEPALGGVCLRVGCIPSKAMLESSEYYHLAKTTFSKHGIKLGQVELDLGAMLKRKEQVVTMLTKGIEGLFKKNKVTRYTGHAKITAPGRVTVSNNGETELEAKQIIIATGSKPVSLRGIDFDGDRIGSSTEALSYSTVPKSLIIIGAGVIGLELGSVWVRLGTQVTVVEYLDRILPGLDSELSADAQKIFEKQGFQFLLGSKVQGARAKGDQCTVEIEGREPIQAERVLMAVGRAPNIENLGLDAVGVKLDPRGRIMVDESFQTSIPGIFAIGDVIPGPMLAHKAEEDGIACVERMVTGHGHVDYNLVPGVVYTDPEFASVGKTEEQLVEQKIAYRKGVFPLRANGRAHTIARTEGKVKVLADQQTDRVLGVHILAPHAGDLIAEATAAMTFGASSEDIARVCHAHPTLSEALKEAALAVDNRPIHI